MAAPLSVPCDIDNYEELEYYVRSHRVSNNLKQKGFCIIRSNLDRSVKSGAHREARQYRTDCALVRVPREACSSLFGETASCWTKELHDPQSKEDHPEEECLREIDKRLEKIGVCVAASSHLYFPLCLQGRLPGVLHHSKMPEDRPAPHLIELEECSEYMSKASVKKITLLHFLGPSPAKLTIRPRQDYATPYEVTIKEDVIIAYRTDACVLSYSTRGFAAAVQVDFVARMKQSALEGPRDALPVPAELEDWYVQRMQQVLEGGPESLEYMPMDFVREAKLSYFTKEPVIVKEVWFDLPALPVQAEIGLTQMQAVMLAGQDVVTEIVSPGTAPEMVQFPGSMPVLSGAKWDMSEYYDEDPESASDFKMYTKHLSVLSHDGTRDFTALREFGVTAMEDASLDHRARMIYEAHWSCVQKLHVDKSELNCKDMGFYAGVSGQNMSMCFNKAKINKHTLMGMSHSAMVSRLPYYFNSKGPAIAIDTEDSSGSVALGHAVKYLLEEEHGPYAFASAATFIEGPFETIMQCAAGVISHSGRSRVFDESADGFVKGEGSLCALLAPMACEKAKQVSADDAIRPAIIGSAVNSKGQSAALAAPSGPSLADVVRRASRDAAMPFNIVDAVEANASGNPLADLIELGATREALRAGDRKAHSVALRATKSSYGNLGAVNGLVAVARTCALLERALHGPILHLHELVDTEALFNEDDEPRINFLTEVIEAQGEAQLVGVSSFGTTGTNVHQILWGHRQNDHGLNRPAAPITWWPAADVEDSKEPSLGYFIVGTMNGWETPLLMEAEGEGVYGYTITMGDNNMECFQIWVNRDEDKVLHPTQVRAQKDSKIVGPESGIGRDLSWCITGITKTIYLINEEQSDELMEKMDKAAKKGEKIPSFNTSTIYPGDYRPEGYENAKGLEEMPTMTLNREEAGKPGDKYRIRLHVRGKYKRLEWSKATGLDAISMPEESTFAHQYMIIGDHCFWLFEPMKQDQSEPGLWVAEIVLLKEKSSFQIYRDSDWEQGFYPAKPAGTESSEIHGPDEAGAGRNWLIQGKVGDVYRIEFRRIIDHNGEERSIRWSYLRSEEVDFEKLAESHEYFLVGTWSSFSIMHKMEYDDDTKTYSAEARIGKHGQESFQILLNSNWLSAVHPSIDDASIFGEDGHTLEGPDDDGSDKYWTIGLTEEEAVSEGDRVIVHMEMSGGLPSRVWWESQEDSMSHQIKLAVGCRRIFERHCRLLGIPQEVSLDRQVDPKKWMIHKMLLPEEFAG